MNIRVSILRSQLRMLLLAFAVCATAPVASGQTAQKLPEWLDRPWELRYVVYITSSWESATRVATKLLNQSAATKLDRRWELLFEPDSVHTTGNIIDKQLTVVLIEFNRDGLVTTPHSFGRPLYGKLHRLLHFQLSPGEYATEPRFHLGYWFMGLSEGSIEWAPGFCSGDDIPSPFSATDGAYLYGPKFRLNSQSNTFGCREWTYQLYNRDRPYIDITSYVPKDESFDKGAYVRDTFGWSRFEDPRKPVIGKYEDHWYCFLECPGGEAPGRIPDIQAWAKKNGWSVPKPPTRVPVFPDPPGKQGHYPK